MKSGTFVAHQNILKPSCRAKAPAAPHPFGTPLLAAGTSAPGYDLPPLPPWPAPANCSPARRSWMVGAHADICISIKMYKVCYASKNSKKYASKRNSMIIDHTYISNEIYTHDYTCNSMMYMWNGTDTQDPHCFRTAP